VGSRGRFPTLSSLVRVAVVAIVLVTASTCSTSNTARNPAPTANSASPAASPVAASPGPPAAANCGSGAWRSAPVHVSHLVAVPSVPVVTAVRAAAHPECGYDRLVLDVIGPLPSYDIRYVTQVTADPSGKPITLPGRSYLLITLHPAQAHTASGASTIIRPVRTLGYPMLTSYAVVGDFEGVFTVALGLHDTTSIRLGELPGHLYIDVRA
jgi:hypothetical protein